jgi:pyridoxamine 5'-phosphate oxidase
MGLRAWIRTTLWGAKGLVAGIDEAELARFRGEGGPFSLFDRWFRQAAAAGIYLHESMTLATATPDGAPSAREVLLKGYGPDGFVFYTSYMSRKAAELELNPRAALLLHWATLHRQIRIEGPVTRTTQAESDAYHRSRPRGSRVAAWASEQSAEIESRDVLERRFAEHDARFPGQDVPLPPFWGGYRVVPERIEFWQGRANRMHDRVLFRRPGGGDAWEIVRLSP